MMKKTKRVSVTVIAGLICVTILILLLQICGVIEIFNFFTKKSREPSLESRIRAMQEEAKLKQSTSAFMDFTTEESTTEIISTSTPTSHLRHGVDKSHSLPPHHRTRVMGPYIPIRNTPDSRLSSTSTSSSTTTYTTTATPASTEPRPTYPRPPPWFFEETTRRTQGTTTNRIHITTTRFHVDPYAHHRHHHYTYPTPYPRPWIPIAPLTSTTTTRRPTTTTTTATTTHRPTTTFSTTTTTTTRTPTTTPTTTERTTTTTTTPKTTTTITTRTTPTTTTIPATTPTTRTTTTTTVRNTRPTTTITTTTTTTTTTPSTTTPSTTTPSTTTNTAPPSPHHHGHGHHVHPHRHHGHHSRPTEFPAVSAKLPEEDVTIVTALLDIGRGDWWEYRRPLEKYHEFMENLLSLKNYMVIFTDRNSYDFVHKYRKNMGLMGMTKIHLITFDDLPMSRYMDYAVKIIDQEKTNDALFEHDQSMRNHPEAKSPEYNIVVNSKTYFLHNVTIEDPFNTEFFAWIDAGYGHGNQSVFPYDSQWKPTFKRGKIAVIKLTPEHDPINNYRIESLYRRNWSVVSGGFLAGDKETIDDLFKITSNKFIHMLYMDKIDDDQTILVLAINAYPHLFDVHQGDWFDAFRMFSTDQEHNFG